MRKREIPGTFLFKTRVAAVLAAIIGAAAPTQAVEPKPATRPAENQPAGGPTAVLSAASSDAAPATQPATGGKLSVDALIKKLGADTYAEREEAADELKKLGKEALPALQKAAKDPDPQIRTGSQAVLADMTNPPTPKAKTEDFDQPFVINNGAVQMRVQGHIVINNMRVGGGVLHMQMNAMANGNGVRDTTVNENGHKVHIHQDNNGIAMEITDNGQTKEYKAKDADELKKNEPEAFKEFEKYGGRGNVIELNGLQLQPPQQP